MSAAVSAGDKHDRERLVVSRLLCLPAGEAQYRDRFFVDWIDSEGGRLCIWDGATRRDALAAASACGLPVVDETGALNPN